MRRRYSCVGVGRLPIRLLSIRDVKGRLGYSGVGRQILSEFEPLLRFGCMLTRIQIRRYPWLGRSIPETLAQRAALTGSFSSAEIDDVSER